MFLLPHQVSLFQGIEDQDPELLNLIDQLAFRRFPKGFAIFEQGEEGTEVFAILHGEVEIVGSDSKGDYVSVAKLKAGQTFGEFSYFTNQPRSFSAVAMTECAIIEISASWLNMTAEQFPVLAKQLEMLFRSRILTNVLRSTKLFSSLSTHELESLARYMELKNYTDGEEILREGEKGNDLYAVKKGRVAICKWKQGQKIALKELGPGEILGEMAAITGEPRSASAHATGSTELLVLSGDRFKALLRTRPKILSTIEDIVRHRSEQTRQALEAVVSEVIEGSWDEIDDAQGLQVGNLNIQCRIQLPPGETRAQVFELSSRKWVITPTDGKEHLRSELETKVQIIAGSAKFLHELSKKGPFSARIQLPSDGKTTLQFGPETSPHMIDILKIVARAKLRGLIFPRYEVTDTPIEAWIKIGETPERQGALRSISLTHATVRLNTSCPPCPIGQLLTIRLKRKGELLIATKAIALESDGSETELQLEYETSNDRTALENVVRLLSGGIGPTRIPSSDEPKPDPIARTMKTVLVRRFESAKEFIRTYISSIDAGLLRVAAANGVSVGMPVQVQLLIPGFPGVRKAVLSGRIKSHDKGTAVVELLNAQQELQTRLRALFEKLIAVHTEESWERRKQELTVSVRQSLWEDPNFRRAVISILLALNVALYLFTYTKLAVPHGVHVPDSLRDKNSASP